MTGKPHDDEPHPNPPVPLKPIPPLPPAPPPKPEGHLMIRRIAATLAALLGLAGIGLIAATPAQAACPSMHTTYVRATWGSQYAGWKVSHVDCTGGYQRLQSATYQDSANVLWSETSSPYGTPSIHIWHGNDLINAVNAFSVIYHGQSWSLGNKICYEACEAIVDGLAHFSDGFEGAYRNTGYLN